MKKYSYLILLGTLTILLLNILVISGCSKENKVILVEMSYIKQMKKVTEISMWDCKGIDDNGPVGMTMRKKTSDQNSISNIMSAIKEADVGGTGLWPSYLNLICFKDSEGKLYCTSIDFEPKDKFVYGWGFIDWDYRLYDVLDAAGLAPKEYP